MSNINPFIHTLIGGDSLPVPIGQMFSPDPRPEIARDRIERRERLANDLYALNDPNRGELGLHLVSEWP